MWWGSLQEICSLVLYLCRGRRCSLPLVGTGVHFTSVGGWECTFHLGRDERAPCLWWGAGVLFTSDVGRECSFSLVRARVLFFSGGRGRECSFPLMRRWSALHLCCRECSFPLVRKGVLIISDGGRDALFVWLGGDGAKLFSNLFWFKDDASDLTFLALPRRTAAHVHLKAFKRSYNSIRWRSQFELADHVMQ